MIYHHSLHRHDEAGLNSGGRELVTRLYLSSYDLSTFLSVDLKNVAHIDFNATELVHCLTYRPMGSEKLLALRDQPTTFL